MLFFSLLHNSDLNNWIKYFDKIKCYSYRPYLVFFSLKPETHIYFFFGLMQITRKRIRKINALEGTVLDNMENIKYLGITNINNLKSSWKRLSVKMTLPVLHLYSKKQDWWGIVKKSIMHVTLDFSVGSNMVFHALTFARSRGKC